MRRTPTLITLGLLALTLIACTADDDTQADNTTTTAAPAADALGQPEAPCTPATPEDITAITATLTTPGAQLNRAFVTTSPDHRFVTANIDDTAGERLSSADTWAIDQTGTIYAVSSSARDLSTAPDGSSLPGGHEATGADIDCIISQQQAG
jgi:hypothetical protein